MLPHRYQSNGFVQSPVYRMFAHIDDHARLCWLMSEASWKTGWGRMETVFNQGLGQTVGSPIRLSGRVFDIELSIEEVVTERDPLRRKVWETTRTTPDGVLG